MEDSSFYRLAHRAPSPSAKADILHKHRTRRRTSVVKKLTLTNLIAILIAIVLFAVGIMLWVIHEQRLEAMERVAFPGPVVTTVVATNAHEEMPAYSPIPPTAG
jgi:hypothetical protein